MDEFAAVEDGYGFLVETTQYAPALVGSALPFTGARRHKEMMEKVRYGGTFIGLLRDHGHGRVEIDANGQAVPYYDLTDELDVRNTHRAIDAQARLHAAAGAREIQPMAGGHAALARRRRPRRVHRALAARAAAGRRLPALLRPPDGHLPDGQGRQDERRRPVGPAARHEGRVDRRRQRVPDVLGHQPDDLDHGARAPHRRGDRRRAERHDRPQGRSRGQLRALRSTSNSKGDTDGGSRRDPGTRQALHRRRVGRPRRLGDDRRRQRLHRGGHGPHPAGDARRTSTARSRPRGAPSRPGRRRRWSSARS